MIMQGPEGDHRRRSPAPNHPWQHPQLRAAAAESSVEPRSCKVTMRVTQAEFHAIRSRAGATSVSEFLRQHFPSDLMRPIGREPGADAG